MYPKVYADYFRGFDRVPEVFVGMPFSKEFEPRWRHIFKPAITSLGLRAHRVKERLVSDSIPVEIIDGIARAKFVLLDVSPTPLDGSLGPPNPNVMYELGLAHAMRLPEEVIILRDSSDEAQPPFDIRHIRWAAFDPENVRGSIKLIQRLLRQAEKEIDLTRDRLVERVVRRLDIDLLSFLETVQSYDAFDLYPFDPDRKGLYGLGYWDSSERELRSLARRLISLGILEPSDPGPPQFRVYGAVPEYVFTPLGRAVLAVLRRERWAHQRRRS